MFGWVSPGDIRLQNPIILSPLEISMPTGMARSITSLPRSHHAWFSRPTSKLRTLP